MIRLALASCLFLSSFPAYAEMWQYTERGSYVVLQETNEPGAVAEIFFDNRRDDDSIRLEHQFTLNEGIDGDVVINLVLGNLEADLIYVYPPDGLIAIPSEAEVVDGETVTIYLFPYVGM
jgi:hypothetical protein